MLLINLLINQLNIKMFHMLNFVTIGLVQTTNLASGLYQRQRMSKENPIHLNHQNLQMTSLNVQFSDVTSHLCFLIIFLLIDLHNQDKQIKWKFDSHKWRCGVLHPLLYLNRDSNSRLRFVLSAHIHNQWQSSGFVRQFCKLMTMTSITTIMK